MSTPHEDTISIDIGYSSTKVFYQGKLVKFPSAVSYYSDVGVAYGDQSSYLFEGDTYYVGTEAVSQEAFTTTDYKFLYKFAPLIIYHILSKFDRVPNLSRPIVVKTGLAMVDWGKKDEFTQRITSFEVNGDKVQIQPQLIPQGAGVAQDWINSSKLQEFPERLHILDIGYNTINSLHFINGKLERSRIKTYPGHGVSSIIKPFTAFLENTFAVTFSEQEAISVFVKGQFKYNGEVKEKVSDKIAELKKQFVTKLFQSVLVNDKKLMAMADNVVLAGGGVYMLQGTIFPPNVTFCSSPYEFSNVRGYSL